MLGEAVALAIDRLPLVCRDVNARERIGIAGADEQPWSIGRPLPERDVYAPNVTGRGIDEHRAVAGDLDPPIVGRPRRRVHERGLGVFVIEVRVVPEALPAGSDVSSSFR